MLFIVLLGGLKASLVTLGDGMDQVLVGKKELDRYPFSGRQEAKSVIHGRPVRSLATNRNPAGGG